MSDMCVYSSCLLVMSAGTSIMMLVETVFIGSTYEIMHLDLY